MNAYYKNVYLILIVVILLFNLITCKQDELGEIGFPRIKTLVVEMVSDTGAVFKGEIIDIPSGCEVIDHGFVWSESKDATEYMEKVSLGKVYSKGNFSATANRAMVEGKKYYFKAFIQTSTTTIYGNELDFVSLGSHKPIIYSITPDSGSWLDTIIVRGKYFSNNAYAMNVYFNNTPAPNFGGSDSIKKITVPINLDTVVSKMSIKYANVLYPSNKEFHLVTNISITSIEPKSAWWNSIIKIRGQHLNLAQEVLFGEIKSYVKSKSDTLIQVIVPPSLNIVSSIINIKTNSFRFKTPYNFELLPAEMNSITPNSGYLNSEIKISGKHMGLTQNVYFDDCPAKIKTKSDSILVVVVPYNLTNSSSNIILKINNLEFKAPFKFNLLQGNIKPVSPSNGTVGTQISLKVNNISSVSKINVEGVDVQFSTQYDSSLVFNLPKLAKSGTINITVSNGTSQVIYKDALYYWTPEITNVLPREISYGDTLTIIGNNLQFCKGVRVGYKNPPFSIVNNQIKIPIKSTHFDVGVQDINLEFQNQNLLIDNLVTIRKPTINNISPTTIKKGDIITITGENFCPNIVNLIPQINGVTFNVISKSKNTILIKSDNLLATIGYLSFYMGGVNITNQSIPLKIVAPWRKLGTSFYNQRPSMTALNNHLYIIDGNMMGTHKYNPVNEELTLLNSYPRSENYTSMGIKTFVYNNQLYAGLGHYPGYYNSHSYKIFRFNEIQNTWDSITKVPYSYFENRTAFLIKDNLYIISILEGNTIAKTKIYNLTNNFWSETDPFPFTFTNKSVRSIVINDNAYVFTRSEAYRYNESTKSWITLKKPPTISGAGAITVFSIGQRIYYLADQELFEYDIPNDNFIQRSSWPYHQRDSYYGDRDYYEVSASIGMKGYVGLGIDNPYIYEYDPSLEP